jgi:hypothetical protein
MQFSDCPISPGLPFDHFEQSIPKMMRKVQAGCLPLAFCLLPLAWGTMAEVQAPFNTTTGSPSTNVRVDSRLPGSSLSPAGFVSALGSKHGFVSAPGDGHLYLNGELFDFRSLK